MLQLKFTHAFLLPSHALCGLCMNKWMLSKTSGFCNQICCLLTQGVVLAATFAVSHNVEEAKPLASGSATTSSLLTAYQQRDWGVQQVHLDPCAWNLCNKQFLCCVQHICQCFCSMLAAAAASTCCIGPCTAYMSRTCHSLMYSTCSTAF